MESQISTIIWQIFKTWYWVLLPFILWPFAKRAWLWWRRELWESKQEYVTLEIIPPKEVKQPLSAMEQVFSNWWSVYSGLQELKNFRKKWLIGRRPYYMTIEIVSFGPYPHFYLRMNKHHRETVESAFYSQYPRAEIREVEDFIKKFPWNAPNKTWNIYGFDEVPTKLEVYPLKSYPQFFEERPELVREEKRVDPIGTLLEGLNQLKKDELMWIQFRIAPITPKDKPYLKMGQDLIDRLLHRKEKPIKKEGEKEKEYFLPPEMKLSPKEKENVKAIEDKIAKLVFDSNIRCIYFGKRDIFHAKRRTLAEQYFTSFNTQDLNTIKRWGKTKSRIRHFFIRWRLYFRNRRMVRWFLMREITGFPRKWANFILSIEELATMFHPPVEIEELGTFLPRVEARKREAPPTIPGEEEPEEEFPLGPPIRKTEPPAGLPT